VQACMRSGLAEGEEAGSDRCWVGPFVCGCMRFGWWKEK